MLLFSLFFLPLRVCGGVDELNLLFLSYHFKHFLPSFLYLLPSLKRAAMQALDS